MSDGIQKIFAGPLTQVDTTAKETLGTLRREGAKTYKYVLYSEGTAALTGASGDFVSYHGDDGYDDVEVTPDVSDGNGVGAGVLLATVSNGEYCWIQTEGAATLSTALTAGADGNALTVVGAGDRTLDVSAAVTDHVCAVAVDASAKKVLLTCPK